MKKKNRSWFIKRIDIGQLIEDSDDDAFKKYMLKESKYFARTYGGSEGIFFAIEYKCKHKRKQLFLGGPKNKEISNLDQCYDQFVDYIIDISTKKGMLDCLKGVYVYENFK